MFRIRLWVFSVVLLSRLWAQPSGSPLIWHRPINWIFRLASALWDFNENFSTEFFFRMFRRYLFRRKNYRQKTLHFNQWPVTFCDKLLPNTCPLPNKIDSRANFSEVSAKRTKKSFKLFRELWSFLELLWTRAKTKKYATDFLTKTFGYFWNFASTTNYITWTNSEFFWTFVPLWRPLHFLSCIGLVAPSWRILFSPAEISRAYGTNAVDSKCSIFNRPGWIQPAE